MNWGVELSLPAYTAADIKCAGQISQLLSERIRLPCTVARMCGRHDLRFRAVNKEHAEKLEVVFIGLLRMEGWDVELRYADSAENRPDGRILVGSFDYD